MSRLVIAIPAYNERSSLPKVLAQLRRTVANEEDVLILVVDDGSTDGTSEVAAAAGADVVLSHYRNLGVASAYRTAMTQSLRLGADIICSIDADGQFEPKEVHKLVDVIRNGKADLVIGSRLVGSRNRRRIPPLNLISNKIMAVVVSIAAGKRVHDAESGFRAISREAALSLNLMGLVSFSHDMIIELARKGYRIVEVPVSVTYYQGRVSRVVGGFLKYGVKATAAIVLKLLLLAGHFESRVSPPPRAMVFFEHFPVANEPREASENDVARAPPPHDEAAL